MRSAILGSMLLVALAGCSLIPHYQRPALPTAAEYPTGPAFIGNGTASGPLAAGDVGWRDFFLDPVLQDLIALALANNRDLRVAAQNVAAANTQYEVQRAGLFPTINAIGSGDFAREPPGEMGSPVPLHINSYSLGLSAVSYELDLFGKIRSLSRRRSSISASPRRAKARASAWLPRLHRSIWSGSPIATPCVFQARPHRPSSSLSI